jgi:hypothetical protein
LQQHHHHQLNVSIENKIEIKLELNFDKTLSRACKILFRQRHSKFLRTVLAALNYLNLIPVSSGYAQSLELKQVHNQSKE